VHQQLATQTERAHNLESASSADETKMSSSSDAVTMQSASSADHAKKPVRLKPLPAVRLETQPEQVDSKKVATSDATGGTEERDNEKLEKREGVVAAREAEVREWEKALEWSARQLDLHAQALQQHQQQLQPMQQQHQQARLVQQKPLTPEPQTPIMASNSTLFKPHTSPDGGSGDSIPLAQEARKLDALEKVNETRKRNQKKETKRETKIATHASTLSSALAKVKDDETSEKSIEMPDRKSQPSKCGICKEAFTSRNALFQHLDDKHKFCRAWKQQPEVEEKTSPRALHTVNAQQQVLGKYKAKAAAPQRKANYQIR